MIYLFYIVIINNGADFTLQNELKRLIYKLPNAKSPGIHKGKKVKSGGYVSVNFLLN